MKKKHRYLPFLLPAILLSMIAAQPVQGQNPSPADCDAYARNYADRSGSVVGGAAGGAARGAIFGAIVGDSDSAGKGAALGAAVGGTRSAVGKNEAHKQAYDACMAGRVNW